MPIKLLSGGREGLELELLHAIVSHNGDRKRIDELKGRLTRRGRLRAVDAKPADDNIRNAPDDGA